jgi:MoaA/NifB/PqqE/SkfB family radical SAM enzyme
VNYQILSFQTLKKVAILFRDHRPKQIANTLRFGYNALFGFASTSLSYDPLWLTFFITSRCNLHCQHCPYQSPQSPREAHPYRNMTMDFFRQVLERFPRTINIGLTGGEPLSHPNLFEMIQLAHDRRMKVHISTNGTLLHGNIDAFLDAPLELLNVSLYGTNAEDFASLTGANSLLFSRTLDALADLMMRRRPGRYPRTVQASFICTKQTIHKVTEAARLCEDLGVDQLSLMSHTFFGIPGYDESMCLYDDDPEVQAFVERFCRQRFGITIFLPPFYRRSYDYRACNMPFWMLSIDGDGYTGPCCIMGTGRHCDNFFEEPDVWNGPTMIRARQNLVDMSQPLPPTCLTCKEMIRERPRIGR